MEPRLILSLFALSLFQCSYSAVLNLTVYYEWKNEKTREFFRDELKEAYGNAMVKKHLHVKFVPFGLCVLVHPSGKYPKGVKCRYGPDQYVGNALESCFFDRWRKNYEQVEFALCMQDIVNYDPMQMAKICLHKLSANVSQDFYNLVQCTVGERGLNLQQKAGTRTKDLRPKIQHLPTYTFNGNYPLTMEYKVKGDKNLTEMILSYFYDFCKGVHGDLESNKIVNPMTDPTTKDMCGKLKIDRYPYKIPMGQIKLQLKNKC